MDLGELTKPERAVWDAFPRGGTVDLGGCDPASPDAAAGDWGPDQRLRADVLARLLLGAVPAEPGLTPKREASSQARDPAGVAAAARLAAGRPVRVRVRAGSGTRLARGGPHGAR